MAYEYTLEADGGTGLAQLDSTRPPGTEPKKEGDNAIRQIKSWLAECVPNLFDNFLRFKEEVIPTTALVDSIISADSAGRAKIAAGAIQASHIEDATITEGKFAFSGLIFTLVDYAPKDGSGYEIDGTPVTAADGSATEQDIGTLTIPGGNTYTKIFVDALAEYRNNTGNQKTLTLYVYEGATVRRTLGPFMVKGTSSGGTDPEYTQQFPIRCILLGAQAVNTTVSIKAKLQDGGADFAKYSCRLSSARLMGYK